MSQSLTPPAPPTYSDQRESVMAWLKANVPDARVRHILRVEEMAIDLANCHKLDSKKAARAGLMHDLAKFFGPLRLLQMAQKEGLTLDAVDIANPHLLHAEVGAIVARDRFGVFEADVLQAIRDHTLGSPGMSPLSCVIYMADGLEPGRGHTHELEELRYLSRQDLDQSIWRLADYSLRHLLNSRHPIHPRTVLTRNWFLQKVLKRSPKRH